MHCCSRRRQRRQTQHFLSVYEPMGRRPASRWLLVSRGDRGCGASLAGDRGCAGSVWSALPIGPRGSEHPDVARGMDGKHAMWLSAKLGAAAVPTCRFAGTSVFASAGGLRNGRCRKGGPARWEACGYRCAHPAAAGSGPVDNRGDNRCGFAGLRCWAERCGYHQRRMCGVKSVVLARQSCPGRGQRRWRRGCSGPGLVLIDPHRAEISLPRSSSPVARSSDGDSWPTAREPWWRQRVGAERGQATSRAGHGSSRCRVSSRSGAEVWIGAVDNPVDYSGADAVRCG